MILCDSILLGQTCDTTRFFTFSKHLENIRGSDLPDSHALKTHIKSITEEVIELIRVNKEQQKTLNSVNHLL